MEHHYCAENENIRIRPLSQSDIELLRNWRNDKQLSTFLSDIPFITQEMQNAWFERYKNDKDTLFFAVIDKRDERVVGSVALYSFSDGACEVGKIVVGDPSAHGRGVGYGSLLLAMAVALKKLNVKEFSLDVHENNIAARKIYEKAGFSAVGRHPFAKGGFEIEMRIDAEDYYRKNPEAERILITENGDMDKEYTGGVYSQADIRWN